MKIAVATDGNQIFHHFGKCPVFTLYTAENGKVLKEETLDASGSGHAALTGFLKKAGADTVVCGGIGDGAKQMLESAGLRLYSGISGSRNEAVRALLTGTLRDLGGACAHEGHEEGHDCSCGSHRG